jgi:hypothetical protein
VYFDNDDAIAETVLLRLTENMPPVEIAPSHPAASRL